MIALNNNSHFVKTFSEVWKHSSQGRRLQILLCFLLMLFSAFAEMVTLGSFLPLLNSLFVQNASLPLPVLEVFTQLHITERKDIILLLLSSFIFFAICAGLTRVVMVGYTNKVSCLIGCEIEITIFENALTQPYAHHLARHSSKIISTLDKAKLIATSILAVLNFYSGIIISISIFGTLVFLSGPFSLFGVLGLGIVYGIVTKFSHRALSRNSRIASQEKDARLKLVQESLEGIRDLIILGIRAYFITVFKQKSRSLYSIKAQDAVIVQSPRIVIETVGIVAIAVYATLVSIGEDGVSAITLIGIVGLSFQRMLPNLQNLYVSWAFLQSNSDSLEDVFELLQRTSEDYSNGTNLKEGSSFDFNDSITFSNIAFHYEGSSLQIFDGLNFKINKGEIIGIQGRSGAGKSTFLDLLIGLLTPTQGEILIDNKSLRAIDPFVWQKKIANVSQSIFMIDGTIAENIALYEIGGPINMKKMESAAKVAQIDDFINKLPKGYFTVVGEKGTKLSGGQKQRIALARAIYKEAEVLVLDEVTSALDYQTEEKIVQSLRNVFPGATVIIVSHRPSILKTCDKVYHLNNNELILSEKGSESN